MKTVKLSLLCLVVFLCLIFLVYGCKKKSQPASSGSETTTTTQGIKDVVTEKTQEVKEIVETLKADATTSISEIKAEVEKLNVDQLKATALQYQELIQAKMTELENINTIIKEIPLANVMSEESLAIKKDLGEITNSLNALKERFQIYYNKLKEKGGDLSGLII